MNLQQPQAVISYADPDRPWVDRLRTHLAPVAALVWDRAQVRAGTNWQRAIKEAVDQARIAVFMLSPDYLTEESALHAEFSPLIARAAQGQVRIFPVLVRVCLYEYTPLAQYKLFSASPHLYGVALSAMRPPEADKAMVSLAREIITVLRTEPADRRPRQTRDPAEPVPTRASVRRLLNAVLVRSIDLDAFCLDHFREVYQEFSVNQSRTEKINLLLQLAPPERILARLREDFPTAVAEHGHFISYE